MSPSSAGSNFFRRLSSSGSRLDLELGTRLSRSPVMPLGIILPAEFTIGVWKGCAPLVSTKKSLASLFSGGQSGGSGFAFAAFASLRCDFVGLCAGSLAYSHSLVAVMTDLCCTASHPHFLRALVQPSTNGDMTRFAPCLTVVTQTASSR